jgi:hypothetical protein
MRLRGFVLLIFAIGLITTVYLITTRMVSDDTISGTSQTGNTQRTELLRQQNQTFNKPQVKQALDPRQVQSINAEQRNNQQQPDSDNRRSQSQPVAALKVADDEDEPQTNIAIPSGAQALNSSVRTWYPLDARSSKCRRRQSHGSITDGVSLIVDFRLPDSKEDFNQVIDHLQMTVDSLLGGSQLSICELLFVGYGPSALSTTVAERVFTYMKSLHQTLIRYIDQVGKSQASARTAAFEKSKESVVVFADTEVIGTVGWLRPLVIALKANDSARIVQPHFDYASRYPADYQTTAESFIVDYLWPLTMRVDENIEIVPSSRVGRYNSPAVRGNIFAIRRNFFTSIGGYDVQLSNMVDSCSTATHLELSLRTWMCGGTIETVPCSRVGIRDLPDRRKVSVLDRLSAERIGQLWFGERRNVLEASVVSQAKLLQHSPPKKERARQITESNQLSTITTKRSCSNIDRYFTEVAKGARVPSVNAVKFGQLRAKPGNSS